MAHPPQPPTQPPPMQPPWQPTWQPPKQRNNRALVIALAIGVPVLLLIVLAVVVASVGNDSDDPNEVAERFLEAIADGDAAAAEAELCEAGASLLPATVEEIIASEPEASLTEPLEDPAPELYGGGALGQLAGTTAEGSATGRIYVTKLEEDDPYCVSQYIFLSGSLD